MALLPLQTNDVGNLPVNRVISKQTSRCLACRAKPDLRIDVERHSSTTRRPDIRCEWNGVSDLVVATGRALELGGARCLSRGCARSETGRPKDSTSVLE
jgi:hypothetical protein